MFTLNTILRRGGPKSISFIRFSIRGIKMIPKIPVSVAEEGHGHGPLYDNRKDPANRSIGPTIQKHVESDVGGKMNEKDTLADVKGDATQTADKPAEKMIDYGDSKDD